MTSIAAAAAPTLAQPMRIPPEEGEGARADDPLAGARTAVATLGAMRRAAETEAAKPPAERRDQIAEFFHEFLDRDGDGKVTETEFKRLARELFGADGAERMLERLDRDRDGEISTDEMRLDVAEGGGVLLAVFERVFDLDGDGDVAEAELLARTHKLVSPEATRALFRWLDADGDRHASTREVRQAFGYALETGRGDRVRLTA